MLFNSLKIKKTYTFHNLRVLNGIVLSILTIRLFVSSLKRLVCQERNSNLICRLIKSLDIDLNSIYNLSSFFSFSILFQPNKGILALLNEECLRPGDVTDITFLAKLDAQVSKHKHYDSRVKSKSDKAMGQDVFKLIHYAGNVSLYKRSCPISILGINYILIFCRIYIQILILV